MDELFALSLTSAYDAAGRVAATTTSGPGPGATIAVGYTPAAGGHVGSSTLSVNGQADSTVTYGYDAAGRMVRVARAGGAASPQRVDFAYVGDTDRYATVTRSDDPTGEAAPDVVGTYTYAPDGTLVGLTYAAGTAVLARYGWTASAPGGTGVAVTPSGYAIADALAESQGGAAPLGSFTDGRVTTAYASDAAGQLVGEADTTGRAAGYQYDANGNRVGSGYVVGPGNQLLADPTATFTYDANGNRTRRVDRASGEVTLYTWDARDRLTGADVYAPDGTKAAGVRYTYDPLNNLVRRVETDGAGAVVSDERYAHEARTLEAPTVAAGTTSEAGLGNVLAVVGPGGAVGERYLTGPRVDEVVAQDGPGAGPRWLLGDAQGTVRAVAVTDAATGATGVAKAVRYDAFGNVVADTAPGVASRFGYTGRSLDPVTGLQNTRARWYDPAQGRWASPDPMGYAAGDANLYRYVGNSPTTGTDPSGLQLLGGPPGNLGSGVGLPVPEDRPRILREIERLRGQIESARLHPHVYQVGAIDGMQERIRRLQGDLALIDAFSRRGAGERAVVIGGSGASPFGPGNGTMTWAARGRPPVDQLGRDLRALAGGTPAEQRALTERYAGMLNSMVESFGRAASDLSRGLEATMYGGGVVAGGAAVAVGGPPGWLIGGAGVAWNLDQLQNMVRSPQGQLGRPGTAQLITEGSRLVDPSSPEAVHVRRGDIGNVVTGLAVSAAEFIYGIVAAAQAQNAIIRAEEAARKAEEAARRAADAARRAEEAARQAEEAARRAAATPATPPRTGGYSNLTKELEGTGLQAHHLNQNAAYRDIIPESRATALRTPDGVGS